VNIAEKQWKMVGATGFEPATPAVRRQSAPHQQF
ncbi:uncharacterized protein METZ01_LOCUS73511, partial [marine metagenome]